MPIVPEFNDEWNARVRQLLATGSEADALFCEAIKKEPRPKVFREIYVIVTALQCLGNFRGARRLIEAGREEEAVVILRSMTEQVIKIRWCYLRASNAVWILLGDHMKQRNRMSEHKTRHPKLAVRGMDADFAKVKIDKRSHYWDRKRGKVKPLPSAKEMAKEARLRRLYETYFFFASQSTHSYHAVMDRFVARDELGRWVGFILDPLPKTLDETARRANWLFGFLLAILRENGMDIDEERVESVMTRGSTATRGKI